MRNFPCRSADRILARSSLIKLKRCVPPTDNCTWFVKLTVVFGDYRANALGSVNHCAECQLCFFESIWSSTASYGFASCTNASMCSFLFTLVLDVIGILYTSNCASSEELFLFVLCVGIDHVRFFKDIYAIAVKLHLHRQAAHCSTNSTVSSLTRLYFACLSCISKSVLWYCGKLCRKKHCSMHELYRANRTALWAVFVSRKVSIAPHFHHCFFNWNEHLHFLCVLRAVAWQILLNGRCNCKLDFRLLCGFSVALFS